MQAGERYQLSEPWEKDDFVANLGNNAPRDVEGHVMTHLRSSERVAVADDLAEV